MRQLLTREEIKERQIEILKYFRAECERLGLWYTLAYGTLLGAVRHGGYIPWDDDIDVCMPRKDYDQLMAALSGEATGRFRIFAFNRPKSYYQNFAKIVDTDTEFIRHDKSLKTVENYGINIDIFPLDNCPGEEEAYLGCVAEQRVWDDCRWMAVKKGWLKREGFARTLAANGKKCVCRILGHRFFMKQVEKRMRKLNSASTGYVCSWSTILSFREIASVDQLYSDNKILFEGEAYSCFRDPHRYLTDRYGDYMQLPPVEQRVPPHGYDAYRKG